MLSVPSVEYAEQLTRDLLEPLGDRWTHARAVATRADELTPAVGSDGERQLLMVAAWWHDLGYSSPLRATSCHQIDGARYLTLRGYPERLCALVAHHSAAVFEAEARGLLSELMEWPQEQTAVSDALWMADMTTGPRGELLDYSERLAEILERYDDDSIVGRAMRRAEPAIEDAIERTRQRMQDAYTI